MGGSGGGYYTPPSPDELKEMIHESGDEADKKAFATELTSFFRDLLKELNGRDTKETSKRLEDLLGIIEQKIEGTLETLFGGSVSKHTYADGISDIDSLVITNDSELVKKSPEEVLSYLEREFRKNDLDATKGRLAVTVNYDDGMEIQLLPAIRSRDKVLIPNPKGEGWSKINPESFANALTKVNKDCGNLVVPTIKLAKTINSQFPEKLKLSGYHLESLAIKAFKGYSGEKTMPEMPKHFFKESSNNVKNPIQDKTGQSLYVDEYMGEKGGGLRQQISHLLSRTYKKMNNFISTSSLHGWKGLFDEE